VAVEDGVQLQMVVQEVRVAAEPQVLLALLILAVAAGDV
jgi:hypothetical protein